MDASSDSVLESQWDDAELPADDDETSETWMQPWDLTRVMNYECYSNTSYSQSGLHDMSAADSISKTIQSEHLSTAAKGTNGIALSLVSCICICKIIILNLQ